MFSKTEGAEKTGEWESRIWIPLWTGEKVSAARTAGANKSGESKPLVWAPRRIEEKVSAAKGLPGYLNRTYLKNSRSRPTAPLFSGTSIYFLKVLSKA
jgi:hypothetical protein